MLQGSGETLPRTYYDTGYKNGTIAPCGDTHRSIDPKEARDGGLYDLQRRKKMGKFKR